VRINRKLNEQPDQPQTEPTEFKCPPRINYLPRTSQLLASIKDLRKKSATTKLEYSQRLVEKSRRIIFETELALTKNR